MKNTLKITGIIAIALLIIISCEEITERIVGNGNVVEEIREPGDFGRIDMRGSYNVTIYSSDFNEVVVEAESNLLPYIKTYVNDDELVIKEKNNTWIKYTKDVYVYIYTTGDISSADLSGSGTITIDSTVQHRIELNISGSGSIFAEAAVDNIRARISGSGTIHTAGTTENAIFEISGSGSIKGFGLITEDCDSYISGSGSIEIFVTDYLYAEISGSGTVYYKGDPLLETKITGSGQVVHKP